MSEEIAEYQRLLRLYGKLNLYTIMSRLDAAERQLAEAVEVVNPYLAGCDQSEWHTINGERLKRILVSPSAIARARAFIQKQEANRG